MQKQRLIPCLVVLLTLATTRSSLGWGGDGHKIVGQIAAQYLTPEAKAEVKALLGEQSLAACSTWADEIKSDKNWRWANPLHYANVKPGAESFDLGRDCPQQGCVVKAIHDYAAVLRDRSKPLIKRQQALKFVVHFVGDVHQPLHVSHARDKGGNDIKVDFFRNRTNLHRVWDSGIIRRTKKKWPAFAAELHKSITPENIKTWNAKTDPSDWATESYKLALSHAYKVPKTGILEQPYFDRNIPVVEERLKIGGVRLAKMLNTIFAAKKEAAKPKAAAPTPSASGASSQ